MSGIPSVSPSGVEAINMDQTTLLLIVRETRQVSLRGTIDPDDVAPLLRQIADVYGTGCQ